MFGVRALGARRALAAGLRMAHGRRGLRTAGGADSGSYWRFGRRLGAWAAGSSVVAGTAYYFGKDEIEMFDSAEPAPELRLVPGMLIGGYPVVEAPQTGRERLVVLGSGWGAVSVLKTLDPDAYDVMVVSPDNYFIFTPLLPSATVGTVEFRSVLEGIRRITKRVRGAYVEASAVDVDMDAKRVLIDKPGEGRVWLPYDRLVVGVGAQSITRGTTGLEFCHRLKTILDARSIRQHIMANFERVMLPTTPDDEKRRLLTFVVCGGGPTGCEFAAELHDLLAEDLRHYFPQSVRDMVRVVIIQSRDHILNMMDSVISEFAEHQFARSSIEVVTNSRVQSISETALRYSTRHPDGSVTEHEIPQGFVLWSTGISLTPFTRLLCDKLPDAQKNRHAISVDEYLRVKGVSDGSVYALGDCATVERPHLLSCVNELFESAHHKDTKEITRSELADFVKAAAAQYPSAAGHLQSLIHNFDYFDVNANGSIDRSEFTRMLEYVDSKLTALPALAQVANQEGVYLGHALNGLSVLRASKGSSAQKAHAERVVAAPFTYHHKGTLAYLGRAAAADFGEGKAYKGSNLAAKYLWRSVYWSQQVSLRTRFVLSMDWLKELLFGRDISNMADTGGSGGRARRRGRPPGSRSKRLAEGRARRGAGRPPALDTVEPPPRKRGRGRPPDSAGSGPSTPNSGTITSLREHTASTGLPAAISPMVFIRQSPSTPSAKEDGERLTEYLQSTVTLPDDRVLSSLPRELKPKRRATGSMSAPTSAAEPCQAAEPTKDERVAQLREDFDQWVKDTACSMNRISELRRQGMLRDSSYEACADLTMPAPLPEPPGRVREPRRTKTAWDQVLTDVTDRYRELMVLGRRQRMVLRKRARQAERQDEERKAKLGIYKRPELAERAQREHQEKLARWTAQQVMKRWAYVESVLDEQRQMEEDELKSKEDKQVLVDMLRRSTKMLQDQQNTREDPSSESEEDQSSSHDDEDDEDAVVSDERSDLEFSSESGEESSDGEMADLARDQDVPIEALLDSYRQREMSADATASGDAEEMSRRSSSTALPSDNESIGEAGANGEAGTKDLLDTVEHSVEQPDLLRGELREYQRQGLDWLVSLHQHQINGILADEMGLGKTIQTIALLAYLACNRGIWGPHLIIVPTSVLLNWEQELHRWLPGLKVLTYYGSKAERKQRRRGWSKPNAFHVCITSYQLALQDASVFRRKPWYCMVLDEAQAIKNFRSQRWQTLLQFRSEFRLLLTGTPLQNSLMELWSLMYFLMPREIGADDEADESMAGFAGLDRFREWFSQPLERLLAAQPEIAAPVTLPGDHGVTFKNTTSFLQDSGTVETAGSGLVETQSEAQQAVERLHMVLRPHILRRLKLDVETQLPRKVEHVVYCSLSKRQRYLYDDFMSRSQTRDTLRAGSYLGVMGCLMQLRKVCNHPDLFETRPIVTSWAMDGSCVSGYRRVEDLVRRMLGPPTTPGSWIRAHGMAVSDLRDVAAYSSSRRLDASADLLHCGLQAAAGGFEVVASREMSWDELQMRPRQSCFRSVGDSVKQQKILAAERTSESWMHLFALNRARIHGTPAPIYGPSVLHACRVVRELEPDGQLVLSGAQRLQHCNDVITRYVFVTPAVVASNTRPGLEAVYPHLRADPDRPWQLKEANPTILHMHRRVRRQTGCLRPLEVRQQIAFPEPFLLQYDCGKLQALDRLMRRLVGEGGHRVLLFTQMTRVLDILEQWLNLHGYRYLRLDGATKVEQRWRLTERFNHDPRWTVFISSTRAGGLGINLTGADTVIFYDSDWNHAMDAQCQDRCHRIGQLREVHIYRLISRDTVEEAIWKKQCEKRWLDHVVIQQGRFDPNHRPAREEAVRDKPEPAEALGTTDWYDLASAVLALNGDTAAAGDSRSGERRDNVALAPEAEDEADKRALQAAIAEERQSSALDRLDYGEEPPHASAVEPAATGDADSPPLVDADSAADQGGTGHIDDYLFRYLSQFGVE
ncbi:swr1 complex component [Coemansia sp. RSA 552]|nr:swr1 complex component [Coemansia sp. RSA 552]